MSVLRYASSTVPSEYGSLHLLVYRVGESALPQEHMAIVAGGLDSLRDASPVVARVHSECWTGEVLRVQKCDCREQLDCALRTIVEVGCGVVVYLRQEGRGIGLGNKIRAYALQEQGLDTVDANTQLGFAEDARTYEVAAAILQDLGVSSVSLLTNNPRKVESLVAHGVQVVQRVPLRAVPNPHNESYLHVKSTRMGHRFT